MAIADGMRDLAHQIETATDSIKTLWPEKPRVGMILGSGLGGLADNIEDGVSIDYATIPHFPRSTALGHQGRLVCGQLAKTPIVAMQGRFHRYEGYAIHEITLPVRVMRALGMEVLIVSNAAGGINPYFSAGDVMIIQDHINFLGQLPATENSGTASLPRCHAKTDIYDPHLIDMAQTVARRANFRVHAGVYVAQRGPNYETRAEYRYLRRIGADAVGMSTAPEALVAAEAGARVLGLSAITNVCLPDALGETTGAGVVETAARAAKKMEQLVLGILISLAEPAGNRENGS